MAGGSRSAPRKLVGRSGEVAILRSVVESVRASGAGRMVLIVGEAGIGKTHLAYDCVANASALGFQVGAGRAWEGAGAPAFFPWSAAFEALGQPLEAQRPIAGDAETFAAIERVAHHARTLARERLLVLVLDDLQWADSPSLLALRLLARAMPEHLLVIGTVRLPERVDPPKAGLLQDLQREIPDVVVLEGLPEHALVELPESCGVDASVVRSIHRVTGGNPFFARELLVDTCARRALAERGDVVVPDRARALLARRFALHDGLAEFVGCAALGPQPRLEIQLVARVLGCSCDRAVMAFEAAKGAGLVVASADGSYAFAHDLMRAAAIEQLAATRRAELHLGWAAALESASDPLLVIAGAFHSIAADPLTTSVAVRDRAFRAGTIAAAHMAQHQASTLFEFAAAADERAGRLGHAARSFAALAEAITGSEDPERGTQLAKHAVELARRAKDHEALGAAAIALTLKRRLGATDAASIEVLEEALHGIQSMEPSDVAPPLHCALEARLASALQPFVDPPRALRLARSSIARARATHDERLLARTLHAARPAFRPLDSLEERFEIDSELLYLATKHGDKELAAQARGRLCMIALERGDAPALDTNLHAYDQLAEQTRFAQHELGAASIRVMRAILRGEVDAVPGLIDVVEAARPRWTSASAVLPLVDPVTLLRGALAVVTGDQASYRALADAPTPPLTRSMFTLFAEVRCGRLSQASALYARVADRVLARDAENFVFRAILANATIALRDGQRAPALYAALAPFAGRHVVWTPYPLYDGSIDRLRAGLAALMGDRDAAEAHAADAIAAEEAFGAMPFARRTRLEREVRLAESPQPTSAEMRASRLKRQWGLTQRQLEVVLLLANGDSNRRIAEMLGCAEHTVEVHVTAILRKANVASRAELIARFWKAT